MLTVSSVADKSINNPPIGGFKHITDPDSLCSTLMQISGIENKALFTGHSGMFTINFCCNDIETTCKEAEKMMREATPKYQALIYDVVVRRKLENIERAAKLAQEKSENVIEALENVLDLVEETSKACSDSKMARERLLEENQKMEKELQEKKKAAEGEQLRKEKEQEEYEEQLENIKEEEKNAGDALPTPWAMLGAYALKAICDSYRVECENNIGLTFDRFKKAGETRDKIEEKIEEAREEIKPKMFEILDIDIQLNHLDLKKVSYDDALEMLQETVELITQLLTFWKQLQERFQSLTNSIQLQLTKKLDQLTSSQSDLSLMSDDILKLLKSTSQSLHDIEFFSKFYAEVSLVYINPVLCEINQCLMPIPERIEQVRKELTENAKKAHDSIIEAIEKEEEMACIEDESGQQKIHEQLEITNEK